jgi:nitrilase
LTGSEGLVVKAAVVQAAPVAFDVAATMEKVVDFAADAARPGVDVVLFPEAFVSCYPRGLSFGTVIGARTQEGRAWYRRYWESSIDVPGPIVDQLASTARAHRIHLGIGVIERAFGSLYSTALIFSPDGELLSRHRKIMPTGAERLVWGSGDGSTMSVCDTPIGKLGSVICWENYMPLMRQYMYESGVELYLAPTADARESWVTSMKHIASEGRCFVLSANQFSRRSDYPEDYPLDIPEDAGDDPVLSVGNSVIVGPRGDILAGPEITGETILRADLDVGRIIEAKFDLDVAGHYSRPDIFQLMVDETRRKPLTHVHSTNSELIQEKTPAAGMEDNDTIATNARLGE